jgi:L-lysine exporter family protein LysE/ArgO
MPVCHTIVLPAKATSLCLCWKNTPENPHFSMTTSVFTSSAFFAGMLLSLSLIMAIGPQNAHVLRVGLRRHHLWITVGVSIVADMVLIALGVAGLAQLGGLSDKLMGVLTGAGAVLLLLYGWRAIQRFMHPAAAVSEAGTQPSATTRRQAALLALALSWLNPHAWLDTAVLIGTASLAYAAPNNTVFGLGAATGSAIWFAGLGAALWLLGRRLDSPAVWRAIDGLVALMMCGTAAWLLASLLR